MAHAKKTKHISMAAILTGAVLVDMVSAGATSALTAFVSLVVNIVWLMEE